MINKISYKLMRASWIPWRMRHRDGPLNTSVYGPARKLWLGSHIFCHNRIAQDDITIVIGIRNRKDFRLVRALESIRNQDYPQDLVHITVVDYGSEPVSAAWLREIAPKYNVNLVPVTPPKDLWNRGHCLNVGIRLAKTKFVLSSDVDIIFAANYLQTAVDELKANPFGLIVSKCRDLPQEVTPQLEAVDQPLDIPALLPLTTGRGVREEEVSLGINAGYTRLYHYIRGYDEYFEGWGGEDDDLARRIRLMGMHVTSVAQKTAYLHQWHPKYEGVQSDQFEELLARNRAYGKSTRRIVVNDANWGNPNPPQATEQETASQAIKAG